MTNTKEIIFQAKNVSKTFSVNKKHQETVLQEINLTINEGEIVSFLGKSGAGKSTLLRIMSGLLLPSLGEAHCCGEVLTGPTCDTSMVFQSFALMPWLTVFDNVAFGLESKNMPKDVIKEKVSKMIDLIGLSGYEKAYPKELSGGMRQRVGFARALAVEPKLLLLDEPFSALDIFTAQKLRHDLVALWESEQISTKSMVLVTHNVEEAVMLSDRVIFMNSNPGRISHEFRLSMPRSERTKMNTLQLVEDISHKLNQQIAATENAGFVEGDELPYSVFSV